MQHLDDDEKPRGRMSCAICKRAFFEFMKPDTILRKIRLSGPGVSRVGQSEAGLATGAIGAHVSV